MATKTESDSRKVLDQYIYGGAKIVEIPTNKLNVDMSYQREFGETLVGRIVSRFDTNKFELPTVNKRPDGSYFVVDGGHRLEAASRLGMKTLTCRLITIPPEDEAMCFIDLNRQRRWVAPVQHFKAELAAKNPAAVEITRVLSERGLRVASTRSPSTVSCTQTLHEIYARGGTVGLIKVVDTVLAAWPENEARRFAGQLLRGIETFYWAHPKADPERLVDRLSSVTASYLLGKSHSRWHAWQSLDQRGASLIEATSEEIGILYNKTR